MKRIILAITLTALLANASFAHAFSEGDFPPGKLMRGSKGPVVAVLQKCLNEISGAGLIADGNFGMGTKVAVQAFQRSRALVADGIVGTKTRDLILSAELQAHPVIMPLDITNSNHGSVSAVVGQTMSLTLGNPGDAGYQFNEPSYDHTALSLISHTRTPSATKMVGDFGTDTWTFRPLASGSTTLQISSARPWDTANSTAVNYEATISIK